MIIVERKVNPLALGHILSHAMHPCINSRRG